MIFVHINLFPSNHYRNRKKKEEISRLSARTVFTDTDIAIKVDDDQVIMLVEEDAYAGQGSGFTLACTDQC